MAAAELIAAGTTAANSSDIVIADGATVSVGLKAYAQGALAVVRLKDDGAAYNEVARLDASQPALLLSGPGTYRVSRIAGVSCGVFSG